MAMTSTSLKADIVYRLTSRKFLLTLSAAISLVATKNYTELAGVIVAYVLGESYIDSKNV